MRLFLVLSFCSSIAAAGLDTHQASPAPAHQIQTADATERYSIAMLRLADEDQAGDDATAVQLLRLAAESGYAPAQFALGRLYETGRGVVRSQTDATHWFDLAARQGHTEAQVNLATQYFLGRGAPLDMRRAARWYERAAEGGNIGAQYIIATLYERGDGVPRDLAQAWHWYRAAALQGDPAAAIRARTLGQRIVDRAQE